MDALSRSPIMLIEDKLVVMIRKKQDEEEKLRVIKLLLERGPYQDYVLNDGILMKRINNTTVIVLPLCMQIDLIW